MPDDSATQKAHAEKIRTERTIQDMTGLSRSDIRRLATWAGNVLDRKNTKKVEAPPEQKQHPQRELTTIPGRGFGGVSEANTGGKVANIQSPKVKIITVTNRQLTYVNVDGVVLGTV